MTNEDEFAFGDIDEAQPMSMASSLLATDKINYENKQFILGIPWVRTINEGHCCETIQTIARLCFLKVKIYIVLFVYKIVSILYLSLDEKVIKALYRLLVYYCIMQNFLEKYYSTILLRKYLERIFKTSKKMSRWKHKQVIFSLEL